MVLPSHTPNMLLLLFKQGPAADVLSLPEKALLKMSNANGLL